MRALGIDTAGPVVGMALVGPEGETLWSERIVQGADGVMAAALQTLLTEGRPDIVGVTVGPGAFTGLRVGVGLALGLATARGLSVVPWSSLVVRAALVPDHPSVLVLLDAKKDRLYAGWYSTLGSLPEPLRPELDVPLADVFPEGPCVAVGEGAVVFRAALIARGVGLVPDADRSPAVALAQLTLAHADRAQDPAGVALRYLRPPDAIRPVRTGPR